jgi:hypothetical protein
MHFLSESEIQLVVVPYAASRARLKDCQNAQRFRSQLPPKSSLPARWQRYRSAPLNFMDNVVLVSIIESNRDSGRSAQSGFRRGSSLPTRYPGRGNVTSGPRLSE